MMLSACEDSLASPTLQNSVTLGDHGSSYHLRSVQWRVNLGILPSSSSIDELRRATANSRRRYAALRRRLLVDPHTCKSGCNSELVIDDPLSQNPDSLWGRFFLNAQLEKMVDQDLSLLYPEYGSYFQTSGYKGILGKILLSWCLMHPEYGYKQGMHELLAPLLYVLQVDAEDVIQIRTIYGDHFTDTFDDLKGLTFNFGYMNFNHREGKSVSDGSSRQDLDPLVSTIILLSDVYGAEGELGVVISEKFIEHDAYCMFDALMSDANGAMSMAEIFSTSPSGLSPIMEASSAVYNLLSVVDSSLHDRLLELGVEPQYFTLRWLRLLFGREFPLNNLLVIWDEIFALDNCKLDRSYGDYPAVYCALSSERGAFVLSMAVSMLLHLRPSLFATVNATSCLQRLLNFPSNVNIKKLIEKAKSIHSIALDVNVCLKDDRCKPASPSLNSPTSLVPESYWEERWRVLQKVEEIRQHGLEGHDRSYKNQSSGKTKRSINKARFDPSPLKGQSDGMKKSKPSVRRSLLEDLCAEDHTLSKEALIQHGPIVLDDLEKCSSILSDQSSSASANLSAEEKNTVLLDQSSSVASDLSVEENNTVLLDQSSSMASNLSVEENDAISACFNSSRCTAIDLHATTILDPQENLFTTSGSGSENVGAGVKENKHPAGIFQWFRKFGRNGGERASEEAVADSSSSSCEHQNTIVRLRTLGQRMLENIQVIESAVQQEHTAAMAAIKELQKISYLLTEM